MTLEEFIKEYHEAPYELDGFAEGACEITDQTPKARELRRAAERFLEARDEFDYLLGKAGVEVG